MWSLFRNINLETAERTALPFLLLVNGHDILIEGSMRSQVLSARDHEPCRVVGVSLQVIPLAIPLFVLKTNQ